jgi:hypothetical protein
MFFMARHTAPTFPGSEGRQRMIATSERYIFHFIGILAIKEGPIPVDGNPSLYYAVLNERGLAKTPTLAWFDKVPANLYY